MNPRASRLTRKPAAPLGSRSTARVLCSLTARPVRRRHASDAGRSGIPDEFTVALDSWDAMKSKLLAQVVCAAGSIRRAARAIEVPRSTLSAGVRQHRERGTWPA